MEPNQKPTQNRHNRLKVLPTEQAAETAESTILDRPDGCLHCGDAQFTKKGKTPNGYQRYECRNCGRTFTYNPDRFYQIDPDAEYRKNVWDIRRLGVKPNIGRYTHTLSFENIQQDWMLEAAKPFIKFALATLSFSSASEKLLAIRRFSLFLADQYPDIQPEEIDRSVIIAFLAHLRSLTIADSTRSHNIGGLRSFLEACYQNQWLNVSRYLIRAEDFPKLPKIKPRYIPESVMQQLNQHLDKLPEPVMRMVLVVQECGMRISELLYLNSDCLLQDQAGDWFLRYYQFKMKKEITIPISREIVQVIQEQQRYIQENLDSDFEYLFTCNRAGVRKKGMKKGQFLPYPQPMTRKSFAKYLNDLAEKYSICDSSGKVWHFQPHQFRHTVGTRMINNGVPQHIIQRYLGHESPNMTAVYAHIHDQTMKEEVAKFQGRVVNIAGQIVEPNDIEADDTELQWFKRNIQAQALPNGSCALPTISQGCPHANACLTCTHFRTTAEYLAEHRQQLQQTERLIEKAKANGWMRQIEMNEKVKANLEHIISALETDADDS